MKVEMSEKVANKLRDTMAGFYQVSAADLLWADADKQEEYFKEYANGNISIGKLAELLDMSILDAQRWAMPKLKAFGLWPERIKDGD